MTLPKISIITPTYNAADTLQACLESVAQQNYLHLEHWIIDGLSKDSTLEIVRDYAQRHSHIKYISEKDQGIYDAMNKGIDLATGEFLLFLGADDMLYDKETLLNAFKKHEPNTLFLYGKTFYPKQNKALGECVDIRYMINGNICHQSIFYHKSLFTLFGKYSCAYKIWSDYIFNLKCFDLLKENEIKFIPIAISRFNETGISQTSYDTKFIKNRWRLTNLILKKKIEAKLFTQELKNLLSWCIHYNMLHGSIFVGFYLSIVQMFKNRSIKPAKNYLHLLYIRIFRRR
jgi:glycosyltransferase involved in cell wall biosynthesis